MRNLLSLDPKVHGLRADTKKLRCLAHRQWVLGTPLRRRRFRSFDRNFGRRVVSHDRLTSAQGKLHQYNDWSFRIVTFATVSRK
jgi:hypothetical protein